MKILRIEDDQPTAAFVEKRLRQAGHQVDQSGVRGEGLALVTTATRNAAVVDAAGPHGYFGKPFDFSGLLARPNALARRSPIAEEATVLRVGDLIMDLVGRTARRGDQPVNQMPREFKLLGAHAQPRKTNNAHDTALAGVGFSVRSQGVDHREPCQSAVGQWDRPSDISSIRIERSMGYILGGPPPADRAGRQ